MHLGQPLGGSFEASWVPFSGLLGGVLQPLGASFGPLRGLLGPREGLLGAYHEPLRAESSKFRFVVSVLGPSWGPLGALLGCLQALLGRLGSLLSRQPLLGFSWSVLGRFQAMGPSWGPLGALLGNLGSIMRPQKPTGREKGRRPHTLIVVMVLTDFGFSGASLGGFLATWSRLGAVLEPLGGMV